MIAHYFLVALRNISRSKGFSTINVLGISVGMAACIFIGYFILFETSYDTFNRNAASIYRVELDTYRDKKLESSSALTPPAVAKSFADNFPEVEAYVRMASNPGKIVLSFENSSFKADRAYIADPSLPEVFSIDFLKGDSSKQLSDPYDLAISENLAEIIFGKDWQKEITLTETLDLRSEGITGTFMLKGVFKNLPLNSHFHPEILVSRNYLTDLVGAVAGDDSWEFNFFYTYIRLVPGATDEGLAEKFNAVVEKERNEALKATDISVDFRLQRLPDIHLKSNIQFELENNGDLPTVYVLAVTGLIILLVAWTNFINLSTARSIKRAKEVGVRKTLGAQRAQLVSQFMSEAMVINAIGLCVSLVVVQLLKSSFSELSGVPLEFMRGEILFSDNQIVTVIAVILIVGTVLTGLYPAFVLSGFKPVKVLKASLIKPGGLNMRRVLVVLQYSLSFIIISATFIIYEQIRFMRVADLGIRIENTVVIEAPENFDLVKDGAVRAFKTDVQDLSFVKGVSMSSVIPGQEITFRSYNLLSEKTGTQINCGIVGIDADFLDNFGLEVTAGKKFSETDSDIQGVILNQEALNQLGFSTELEAIGSKVIHQNKNGKEELLIEGVVRDYHHRSLHTAIEPTMFRKNRELKYYSVRLQTDDWKQTEGNLGLISKVFERQFPGNPFNSFFLDQQFDAQYKNEVKFQKIFLIFSILAVIISSLGVLALSTFTVNLRSREIGIRKVFGASESNVTLLLFKDYFKLLLISILMSIPVIVVAAKEWLSNYSFRIEVEFFLIALPILAVVLIAILTVGAQTLHAALKNPIESIRHD